jgi:hypothetical protein
MTVLAVSLASFFNIKFFILEGDSLVVMRHRMLATHLRVDLTRGRVACTRRCVKPFSRRSTTIHLLWRRFSGSLAGLWPCVTPPTTPLLVFGFFYMLSSLLFISVLFCIFVFYVVLIFCCFLFVFSLYFLVLLLSVATVVLSRFSFAIVVISSSNSKIFHAAIKYLSSAITFGEGHAASQAVEVCSFVFLFWFSYCLCSALFSVHVVDGPLLQRHLEKHSQP